MPTALMKIGRVRVGGSAELLPETRRRKDGVAEKRRRRGETKRRDGVRGGAQGPRGEPAAAEPEVADALGALANPERGVNRWDRREGGRDNALDGSAAASRFADGPPRRAPAVTAKQHTLREHFSEGEYPLENEIFFARETSLRIRDSLAGVKVSRSRTGRSSADKGGEETYLVPSEVRRVENAVASVSRFNTSARPPTEASRRIDRTLTPIPACPHPGASGAWANQVRASPVPSSPAPAPPSKRAARRLGRRRRRHPRASPAGLIAATSRPNADASSRDASRGFLERLLRDASFASRAGGGRRRAERARARARHRLGDARRGSDGRALSFREKPTAPPRRDAARSERTRARAVAPHSPASTSPLPLPVAVPRALERRLPAPRLTEILPTPPNAPLVSRRQAEEDANDTKSSFAAERAFPGLGEPLKKKSDDDFPDLGEIAREGAGQEVQEGPEDRPSPLDAIAGGGGTLPSPRRRRLRPRRHERRQPPAPHRSVHARPRRGGPGSRARPARRRVYKITESKMPERWSRRPPRRLRSRRPPRRLRSRRSPRRLRP